ncbi:MAG: hypothetical protein K6U80_04685 [Firmicutes bacterium]|nr:hypothetical protein [Bacillota bacterium]
MAKLILFSYPLDGQINPTLGLATELTARGEELIYYATGPYRQKIEATGAIFRPYPVPVAPELDGAAETGVSPRQVADGVDALVYMAGGFLRMAAPAVEALLPEVRRENPGYLIHDALAWFGKQLGRILKIPAVSSIPTLVINRKMLAVDPQRFRETVFDIQGRDPHYEPAVTNRRLAVASRQLGKLYGIGDFEIWDAFLAAEGLNLVYTSREFQFHGDLLGEEFQFVGPSLIPRHEPSDQPLDFLDGRPLIYISLGTLFNANLKFYRACFQALADWEGQVVMAVGDKLDAAALGGIPANFQVRNYLPQLEILQRASLFITHGGMNSVSEGLYHGLPLILAPQYYDQFLVAHRVAELGAGVYLRGLDCPEICVGQAATQLRAAVDRLFADDAFRRRSTALGQTLRAAGGYRKAADVIFEWRKGHLGNNGNCL